MVDDRTSPEEPPADEGGVAKSGHPDADVTGELDENELTDEQMAARFERLRWLSQSRQAVGWALDRASGWGPVPEVAGAVRQIAGWVRPSGPLRIDGYRSFGGSDHVRIRGRVLASPEPGSAQEGERSIKAAGRMATRFMSAEVADVTVEVCYDGVTRTTVSNDEGYFDVDFRFDRASTSGARWSVAQARILDDDPGSGQWWPIEVLVVGRDVDRIIVSDVDDTILVNGVGAALRTVLTTISGSELTRDAVPGAADVYQHLCHPTGAGAECPIFYVSSSPWNLYDFLVAFLDLNRFPPGPLLLRDIGLSRRTFSDSAHHRHKIDSINDILERLPDSSVVLIGDSSLQDANAFADIIDSHPGRVEAAFLRDVGDEDRTARAKAILEERRDAVPPILLVADMAEIVVKLP